MFNYNPPPKRMARRSVNRASIAISFVLVISGCLIWGGSLHDRFASFSDIVKYMIEPAPSTVIPADREIIIPSGAPCSPPTGSAYQPAVFNQPYCFEKPDPAATMESVYKGRYLSSRKRNTGVYLVWDTATSQDFREYQVLASEKDPCPTDPECAIASFSDRDTTTMLFDRGNTGHADNRTFYIRIAYRYGSETVIYSNVIKIALP